MYVLLMERLYVHLAVVDKRCAVITQILPSGALKYAGGSLKTTWISLDGISFPTAAVSTNGLKLEKNFRPLRSGYASPRFTKQSDLCVLKGVVKMHRRRFRRRSCKSVNGERVCVMQKLRDSYWRLRNVIGRLPARCRPKEGTLSFRVGTARIDVQRNGQVRWMNMKNREWMVSLNGISFFTASQDQLLRLSRHWKPHSLLPNSVRRPAWKRQVSNSDFVEMRDAS